MDLSEVDRGEACVGKDSASGTSREEKRLTTAGEHTYKVPPVQPEAGEGEASEAIAGLQQVAKDKLVHAGVPGVQPWLSEKGVDQGSKSFAPLDRSQELPRALGAAKRDVRKEFLLRVFSPRVRNERIASESGGAFLAG